MDFYMNSAGIAFACRKEYEIDTEKDLTRGCVLTLSDGKAKVAEDGDTVLGILEEDYKVEKEELNPRSGSGRVRVIVSPGMICKSKANEFTVETAGDEVTVNISGLNVPTVANALKGGCVQLVSKAENSKNKDAVGSTREIVASAGTKLTVAQGGASEAGDAYRIYPPAGCKYIALCEDAKDFELCTAESKTAKTAHYDTNGGFVEYIFTDTFFN